MTMKVKLWRKVFTKITCFIILIINIFGICLLQTGCEALEYEQITIGDYVYAEIPRGSRLPNDYLLVRLSEIGKQKEILVLSTSLNGKNVVCGKSNSGSLFSNYKQIRTRITPSKMKKLLIENLLDKEKQESYGILNVVYYIKYEDGKDYEEYKLIVNGCDFSKIRHAKTYKKIYMRMKLFNENIFETIDGLKSFHGNYYSFEKHVNYLRPVNVEFHWNYEKSPQEDYYWIDDIENGELIEEIPPIPEREGYTFGGWYTEKECINEFSFSTPISKMDIDWEELLNSRQQVPDEYVTCLYAKWIKI